jgi:hypothetical protein
MRRAVSRDSWARARQYTASRISMLLNPISMSYPRGAVGALPTPDSGKDGAAAV